MTTEAFADWLARGRSHRSEGRPIDAMLCLRRALRECPDSIDARLELGEALWQLGRDEDAIALWRESMLPSSLDSPPHRTRAAAAIAVLWSSDDEAQAKVLATALVREPDLLRVSPVADALTRMLATQPQSQSRESILAALADVDVDKARVAAMPAELVAMLVERCARRDDVGSTRRRALIEATVARRWSPRDHDAVRRIAVAALPFAPRESIVLAQSYANLCMRSELRGAPMAWPRRTRGESLRVVVVAIDRDSSNVQALRHALSPPRFAMTLIDATGSDGPRIALLDADVVIDLAGLSGAVGLTLAQRPARLRMTIAALPLRNHPPLVDHVAADVHELIERLTILQRDVAAHDADSPDASAIASLWADAVEAHRSGDRPKARSLYARVLDAQPDFAPAHHLLGVALREDGDVDGAQSQFAAAMRAAPSYVAPRIDSIRASIDANDAPRAVALAREAASISDELPVALLRAMGSAYLAAHHAADAAACFEAALTQEPADAETHYNHGVALQMQRRYADAARAYQRAIALRPDFIAADFNLGTIFMELGNRDAAISAFSAVTARDASHVSAHKNLGELLLASGKIDTWRANFRHFEAHCRGTLPFAVHALEMYQYAGDFERIDSVLNDLRNERFVAAGPLELADSLEELLFVLLYFDVEPQLLHRFAQTYDTAARAVYGEPLPTPTARRPGKLRIGYLSGDLRNHVMGKQIYHALRHHDRERFDISFYSLSNERDDWTRRFEAIADRFYVIAGLGEREAAQRIAAADLDVLVDLSTHTKGARPGILALKPARVQITHIASAGTVGLSTIDFKLTDRYADVADNQMHQIETLLPMEGCVYPYRHIEPSSTTWFERATFGIAKDAIVIGAFITAMKLSRRCLALWRRVLDAVPRARLAFSPLNAAFAELYTQVVTAAGIDPHRIVFLPQSKTDEENQARYRIVDFVLDPMPYGGVNGTLEALDMGVPVVTLVGKRHAERTSFSILTNLGVTQTIAHGADEYIALAVRLANDKPFMADVRAAIRAGLARSPLTDMEMHTRHLEAAYVEALRLRAPDALASTQSTVATS